MRAMRGHAHSGPWGAQEKYGWFAFAVTCLCNSTLSMSKVRSTKNIEIAGRRRSKE